MFFIDMDSGIDPRTVVNLRTSLEHGLPIPAFILSEVRSRDEKTDIIIETLDAQVRLTNPGSATSSLDDSVVLAAPVTPTTTIYPNIFLDETYVRLGLL